MKSGNSAVFTHIFQFIAEGDTFTPNSTRYIVTERAKGCGTIASAHNELSAATRRKKRGWKSPQKCDIICCNASYVILKESQKE